MFFRFWKFCISLALLSKLSFCVNQFGDIGEEHDLDDLITKRFQINHVGPGSNASSSSDIQQNNSTKEDGFLVQNFSGDIDRRQADTLDSILQTVLNNLSKTETFTVQHFSGDDENSTKVDSINHGYGSGFLANELHELTPGKVSGTDAQSVESTGMDTTSLDSYGISGSGDSELPGDSESNTPPDLTEHDSLQNSIFPLNEQSNTDISVKNGAQNTIFKSLAGVESSRSEPLKSKKSTVEKTVDPGTLNFLPKLQNKETLKFLDSVNSNRRKPISKTLAREQAVRFVKFFRDGVTLNVAERKRSYVPTASNIQRSNRPRNEIQFFTSRFHTPRKTSMQEIFKRDHIEIHKNIRKLANMYKGNSLLSDLSKMTNQWRGYNDNRRLDSNPVWMKFLRDAMRPHEMLNMNADNRQRLLGYMYRPSNGNKDTMLAKDGKLFKKVGSINIKPGEIQAHFMNDLHKKQSMYATPGIKPHPFVNPQSHATQPNTQATQPNYKPSYNVQTFQSVQQHPPQMTPYSNYPPQQFWTQPKTRQSQLYPHINGINSCLPENSLCDAGHDEQCCGPASFCIDYWGTGKCISMSKNPELNDHRNTYKMWNNLNAKRQFNRMLNQVKNEISLYGFQKKLSDILNTAKFSKKK
ncbi:uncharacterized protein [Clytia hemisphaerica]|uniref:Uncharacterized protein n=1 Tax=Clytia hemisphaerica TaxID=252671 RepID=A0A7M6DN56_9CNID